jgi:hypothetical protein
MFIWRWTGPEGKILHKFRPIARSVVMLACGGGHWIGTQMQEQARILTDVHAARRRRLIGSRSEMVRCTEDEQQILAVDHGMGMPRGEFAFAISTGKLARARNRNGFELIMTICLLERSLQSRRFDQLGA